MSNGIKCPKCYHETEVKDSRGDGKRIRRRRVCVNCRHRITTLEVNVSIGKGSERTEAGMYSTHMRKIHAAASKLAELATTMPFDPGEDE